MTKNVPPSISETAFSCPHCGAYTTQHWHYLLTKRYKNAEHPHIPSEEDKAAIEADTDVGEDVRQSLLDYLVKVRTGLPFLERSRNTLYADASLDNCCISECFNCSKLAVWVHDSFLFPSVRQGQAPNQDMPVEVLKHFEEARSILELSPRGAAALLRLCVQNLCRHLGENGKNIDDDIASLVAKGLNPLVQQSLDVVRVIGNEAVHPGVIDLNDNKDIAIKLFGLINAIADQMITHPKTVASLYGALPEEKRKAIESRNARVLPKPRPE